MNSDIGSQTEGFFGYTDIGSLVTNLVSISITLSGILVFLMLVWGGVEWITSGGEKAHIESAQKRITNAIIGLAIVAASWAIWTIVKVFFGLDEVLPS